VALIKERLGIDPETIPGDYGQFEVSADGETVAARRGNWLTRGFGLGYPDAEEVVDRIEARLPRES
jgi:hypothetical protein